MNGQLVNFDKLVDGGVNYPQFAMVTLLRLAACSVPLLIGLTSRCFAHRARASCAPRHCHPLQFPLKSCGFSSAETVRKRFLLWKMGFSDAAYCEPMHPSIQHGRPTPSHRPALTLARCSAPADFASLRVLEAPAASRPPTLASSLAALPASLGLLRAVSPTGRALRAPPPYTPPGTIKARKGFAPFFGFLTDCGAARKNRAPRFLGWNPFRMRFYWRPAFRFFPARQM